MDRYQWIEHPFTPVEIGPDNPKIAEYLAEMDAKGLRCISGPSFSRKWLFRREDGDSCACSVRHTERPSRESLAETPQEDGPERLFEVKAEVTQVQVRRVLARSATQAAKFFRPQHPHAQIRGDSVEAREVGDTMEPVGHFFGVETTALGVVVGPSGNLETKVLPDGE